MLRKEADEQREVVGRLVANKSDLLVRASMVAWQQAVDFHTVRAACLAEVIAWMEERDG